MNDASKILPTTPYRGRFAPSPTGPLHIGSLLTALGSFLEAKSRQGKWLLRIDDLDPPREVPGAADQILKTLEHFSLEWDESVFYQSKQNQRYHDALQTLANKQLLFPCACSRKSIQENTTRTGKLGIIYPGTCRRGLQPNQKARSQRLICENKEIVFEDGLQGLVSQNIANEVGDIPLLRADGYFAYHLAVALDDDFQNVSHVVRGMDLLDCTPVQIYLQQCLSLSTPDYLHLPVLVNQNQEKLSKQTGANAISLEQPEITLIHLLNLLSQNPPAELRDGNVEEILQWGVHHWNSGNCTTSPIIV